MKLFFCGNGGENYGWGTCISNLKKYLAPLCELEIVEKSPACKLPGPAFVPIVDYKLNPIFEAKAERVIGYCFAEAPLDDDSRANAAKYDLIFAGSTWNKQRIVDAGIKTPCKVLIQGIDHSIFKPQPIPDRKDRFIVFSGGKYEFRKGQDYVAAAMKHFMAVHPEAILITAWHNHWKASEQSMKDSWLIEWDKPLAGLPADRVFALPLVSHAKLPEVYAQSHIGLFPNRCEAGTNLVMCEYMACGRPVIASYAHGHRDILAGAGPYVLKTGSYDPAGWFNPEVCDILAALEHAYHNRHQLAERGQLCHDLVKGLSWQTCAAQIVEAAFPLVEGHDSPEPARASQ
jgi:glycosyltransferase involved in cell wall biosynthesis